MSLKTFHIVFIVLAILLSAGCALWAFANHTATGFGVCSIVVGLALVIYGVWFLKKSRHIIT